MKVIYSLYIIIVTTFITGCCHQSKCFIEDIDCELLHQNSITNKNISLVLSIHTTCTSGGSCKPGYGGSEDYIENISIILKQNQKELDISNKLVLFDEEHTETDGFYRYTSIKELILNLNDIMAAKPNRNQDPQLDTGFDLELAKFPFKFDHSLVNEIRNNDLVITQVKLNKNRTLTDSVRVLY